MSILGPGSGVLSAIGETLGEFSGTLYTRLTAPLAPAGHETPPADALSAAVETTIYMAPGGGSVAIEGETITYGAAAVGALTGLSRDPFVKKAYPRGTLVAYLGTFSDLDRARDSLVVSAAEATALAVIGQNLGVPRYLDAPDDQYRDLIRAVAYMPAKGSRSSIDDFLAALLGDMGLDGTADARAAAPRLVAAAGTFRPSMARLLVDITTPTRERRTRIARVSPDGTTAHLDRWGSPHWEPADLADEDDVEFRVLPFEVVEPAHKPCTVEIRVRTAPPSSPLGFAFLQGGEAVSPAQVGSVVVSRAIRQVLGVWLATDATRQGTNYATSNNFAGSTITLDVDLPAGPADVLVDYGWAFPGSDPAPVSGIPGAAAGRATAELLLGVATQNPEPVLADGVVVGQVVRYPLYLGGRLSVLLVYLGAITVAGVIPELSVSTWESA